MSLEQRHRETLYRGRPAMSNLRAAHVILCGIGAIGSNLAVTLAKCGVGELTIIDFDRVDIQNIGTQAYGIDDIGSLKIDALESMLYTTAAMAAVNKSKGTLAQSTVQKLLKRKGLIIDCLDNSSARRIVYEYAKAMSSPCLHAGVNDEFGEIRWNESYRVPSDHGLDICNYPMARTLIQLVVSVTAEVIIRYLTVGVQENYSITLQDMKINRER